MKIRGCFALASAAALYLLALPGSAGELFQDYAKLIGDRTGVGVMGPDLLGDQVNYYSGGLSFANTDVSVAGNSSLPVSVTRTYSVKARNGYPFPDGISGTDLPFGDWDLDLPRITGVFAQQLGWVGDGTATNFRCSRPSLPPAIRFTYNYFVPDEYFNGLQLSLAGGGGGELLGVGAGVTVPSVGGPYVWLTQDRTVVSCLPSVQNSTGEGYLATTPDGTRYWLNSMASFAESSIRKARKNLEFRSIGEQVAGFDVVARRKYALYATRVEDRFGNWVAYTYSNAANAPVRLSSISSSDGRAIALGYNTSGQISTVATGSRIWSYQYDDGRKSLTAVVLPDGSRWTLALRPFTSAKINYEGGQPGDPLRSCMDPGGVASGAVTATITHPSGATGEFTVEPLRFGRSNVLAMCKRVTSPYNDPNDDTAIYPIAWDSYALTRKRLSGPGLSPAEWNYSYYATISWFNGPGGSPDLPVCTGPDCISPQCVSDACAGSVIAQVNGPNGFTRYTFGNSYRYNEGKLLKTESGSSPANILRSETQAYQWPAGGLPYVTRLGYPLNDRNDAAYGEAYLRPEKSRVIQQQGGIFTRAVEAFDGLARPLQVRNTGVISP